MEPTVAMLDTTDTTLDTTDTTLDTTDTMLDTTELPPTDIGQLRYSRWDIII